MASLRWGRATKWATEGRPRYSYAVVARRDRLNWTMSEEDHRKARAETLVSDVRQLTPGDLDVVFQPIVDLNRKAVFAVEALARCPRTAFDGPMSMFEEAARVNYCGRLGRQIRDITFERCAGYPVFVNVHPDELQARWIVRPDDPIGLHDSHVFLEITEVAAFDRFELVSATLGELSARGVHTVIDDFGAGYSNLRRIAYLKPAVVKLDRSLVQGIDESRTLQRLIKSVVDLCTAIGARVVVEGIETPGELSAVIDTGAHYAQGYIFARPAYPIPGIRFPKMR